MINRPPSVHSHGFEYNFQQFCSRLGGIINSTVRYRNHMIPCEYCTEQFIENMNGLAEKTFHELLHEPEMVNK